MAKLTNNFFSLALCSCVAAHVWFGRCRCQRLETTHCLQERLLSQPSRHTVVLEGMSAINSYTDAWTHATKTCTQAVRLVSHMLRIRRCLSLAAACGQSVLLLIKDQSLFRRTGLFALMKELRVKTTLVIIWLDHLSRHTNTLPQQTTLHFYTCSVNCTQTASFLNLNWEHYGVGKSSLDVWTVWFI